MIYLFFICSFMSTLALHTQIKICAGNVHLVGWTSVRVFNKEPFKASLSAKWIVPPILGIIQMSQT